MTNSLRDLTDEELAIIGGARLANYERARKATRTAQDLYHECVHELARRKP